MSMVDHPNDATAVPPPAVEAAEATVEATTETTKPTNSKRKREKSNGGKGKGKSGKSKPVEIVEDKSTWAHKCQFCDDPFKSRNALFKHLRTQQVCFEAASVASGKTGASFAAHTVKWPKQKVVIRFGYHVNTTSSISTTTSTGQPPNEAAAQLVQQIFMAVLPKHHPIQQQPTPQHKDSNTNKDDRMTHTTAAKHRHLCLSQDWDCSASSDYIGVYYHGEVLGDFGPVLVDVQQQLDDHFKAANTATATDGTSHSLTAIQVLDARVIPLTQNFAAEKSCTQRVYHYLLPLEWLTGGAEAQTWWLKQGGRQQFNDMRKGQFEHRPRTTQRRPEVLKRLKLALSALESVNVVNAKEKKKEAGGNLSQMTGVSPGRFGNLWIKERRCWHNFADPALRGMASPSNDPVWRALDRAKVLKISGDNDDADDAVDNNNGIDSDSEGDTGETRMMAVVEFRGDGFVTQQVRRMMGAAIAMTNGWLPLEYADMAIRSDICLETPLAPAGHMYFAGGRFHFLELTLSQEMRGLFKEREPVPEAWQNNLQSNMVEITRNDNTTVQQEEQAWLKELQEVVAPRIQSQLAQIAKDDKLRQERAAVMTPKTAGTLSPDHVFTATPDAYEETVSLLRKVVSDETWPRTSKARSRVIRSTDEQADYSQQHGSATFDGERFQCGSFTVVNTDLVDGKLPLGNELFPELAKSVFQLEAELAKSSPAGADGASMPAGVRTVSTHCAVNRNAEFVPHVDSGRGAGQSVSMIAGLGDYEGGEIFVEGQDYDIRYKALEFDGWKQRHWTAPFEGERYSLVWFTPAGNASNVKSGDDVYGNEEDRKAEQFVLVHQKQLSAFPLLKYRPDSTDALVISEMFDPEKGCTYELKNQIWGEGNDQPEDFLLTGHECVLDIGAHIGAFSRFALAAGCKKVLAYEPEPSNQELLKLNLQPIDSSAPQDLRIFCAAVAHGAPGKAQLVHARTRGDGSKNTWRHALEDYSQYIDKTIKMPTSKQEGILTRTQVSTVPFFGGALVPGVTFVKLDCEGAEIDILLADEASDAKAWLDVTHLVFEWSFTKEKRLTKFRKVISHLKEAGFQVVYDGQGAWWDTEDPQAMWTFHNDLVVYAKR